MRWTVPFIILLVVLSHDDCLGREVKLMTKNTEFKSAHDLRKVQAATSVGRLPREIAYTLPVPKKIESEMVILVLFYYETGPMNHRTVHLPERVMYLNPVTGEVQKFCAIRSEEVGIKEPLTTVLGAGVDPMMTGDEFYDLRQRFLDISAEVWAAFASGKTEFETPKQAIIKEYESLFLRITKKEVAPFYVMSSPHFFKWLRTVNHNR
jgi:hypothetical protein